MIHSRVWHYWMIYVIIFCCVQRTPDLCTVQKRKKKRKLPKILTFNYLFSFNVVFPISLVYLLVLWNTEKKEKTKSKYSKVNYFLNLFCLSFAYHWLLRYLNICISVHVCVCLIFLLSFFSLFAYGKTEIMFVTSPPHYARHQIWFGSSDSKQKWRKWSGTKSLTLLLIFPHFQ